MAGNLVLGPLKEGGHSDPYGHSSALSPEGSFQELGTNTVVGSWTFVKMLCADGGGLTVSCCPGLLLSGVTTFIHTCVVQGKEEVSLMYKEQPTRPGSCAEGMGTAEITYVPGKTLTWPPCCHLAREEVDSGSDTVLVGGFRSALVLKWMLTPCPMSCP